MQEKNATHLFSALFYEIDLLPISHLHRLHDGPFAACYITPTHRGKIHIHQFLSPLKMVSRIRPAPSQFCLCLGRCILILLVGT